MTRRHRTLLHRLSFIVLVLACGGTSAAEGTAASRVAPPTEASRRAEAWTRHLDPDRGFTIDVPAGHPVYRSGTIWYVQDPGPSGGVGLPGMTVTLVLGASADEELATFPADREATEVTLGPGTPALRVVAAYETMAAGRYRATTYLVPAVDGVYVLSGWEDLAWEPFERVAASFTLVRPIPAPDAGETPTAP